MKILDAQYMTSTTKINTDITKGLPEICFIGRSNVGKSSMINHLVSRKIARTSSTPGATKLINLYKVHCEHDGQRRDIILSDFPGFGYSKVSKKTFRGWQEMVERYILDNKCIKRLLWVFDVRREMDALDEMLIEWILGDNLEFSFVLTKTDKESRNFVINKKNLFSQYFTIKRVFLFSAKNDIGKMELLSHISSVTA